MGLTIRRYIRYMKYGLNPSLKSRRKQYPLIKRNSHHRLRRINQFSDSLNLASFNNHQYKHHLKDSNRIGTIRNGRYGLQDYFKDFDRIEDTALSKRAKLRKEIQKQETQRKKGSYLERVGKNGLFQKDLLLMAWKMLQRRGTLEPFRGHREKGQLYKREAFEC